VFASIVRSPEKLDTFSTRLLSSPSRISVNLLELPLRSESHLTAYHYNVWLDAELFLLQLHTKTANAVLTTFTLKVVSNLSEVVHWSNAIPAFRILYDTELALGEGL